MKREERTICYDEDLQIEAYRFKGIMQQFPNHFHEHYVIGFIEEGTRLLECRNIPYTITPGQVVIFNPYENHTCSQIDAIPLDYRCLNILPEIMEKTVAEITGHTMKPIFSQAVIQDMEIATALRDMHRQIMEEVQSIQKEETFLLLIEQLITRFALDFQSSSQQQATVAVQKASSYLETNFANTVSLEMLSQETGLSKYYLLRSFTKQKGISPYRYLENIRVNEAKKLLAQGVAPLEAALSAGFTDQSHFTNYFKNFIGLTPGQYRNIFK